MATIVLNMLKPLNRFLLLVLSGYWLLAGVSAFAQDKAAENPAPKTAAEATPNNSTVEAQAEKQLLLSKELEDDSLVWLKADNEKFIALWEPDTSSNSLGSVLILHGEGENADWPDTINPIRTALVQFGWSTLSIELPNSQQNIDAEKLAAARIQAAAKYLDQKGQYNIVIIGSGTGANRGLEFLQEQPARPNATAKETGPQALGAFRALIIINARNIEITRKFKLPILDLYFNEHYLDDTEAKKRDILARKYHLPYYHQVHLLKPEVTDPGDENRLTRRIRGFLNKYAKGVEVKRK